MKNSIKALAKEAKNRMRTSAAPENKGTLADISQEEERVFQIVCKLAASDEVVTNPIMRVADPAVWKSVRGVDRERYVLNLSAVYCKQLQRYQAQKS